MISLLRQQLKKSKTAVHFYRLVKVISLDPLNYGKRWHFVKSYLWWFFWAKPRGKKTDVRLQNGMLSTVYADSDSGESNLFTRNVDFYDTVFIRSVLRYGDFIVDAGCNVGNRTLALADMLGGALLLDANAQCLERAQRNFTRNGLSLKKYFFQTKAVGAERGVLRFSDMGGTHCSNHILSDSEHVTKWVEVPVITIDEVLKTIGNPACHFLKLDLEGFDLEGLKGAVNTLKSKEIRLVKFERWASRDLEAFIEFFEQLDWIVFGLDAKGIPSLEPHVLQTNSNLFAVPQNYWQRRLEKKYIMACEPLKAHKLND